MMKSILFIYLLVFTFNVWACDPQTGERQQRVYADINGHPLAKWQIDSALPKVFELESGLKLGILIQEATAEKYQEISTAWTHVPELVSIELLDMNSTPPTRLSRTWGGANSIQGFGSKGGADVVEALGDPGLTLHLVNPVCIENTES